MKPLCLLLALGACFPAHLALAAGTELISVSGDGVLGNADSGLDLSPSRSISADGRFVAFSSEASNLVPGDTDECRDVFVRDRLAGTTERVSVSTEGAQAYRTCSWPSIGAAGRFVTFLSESSTLVEGHVTAWRDVFLRDRLLGTTEVISLTSSGEPANYASHGYAPLSGDGRLVAFPSWASNLVPGDTNAKYDIFLRDRLAETTECVSVAASGLPANDDSALPSISADGRFVAFASSATDLVSRDTNGCSDVFVRDRQRGITDLVSVSTSGEQGNAKCGWSSISADGRFVAFYSFSTNLVPGDTNGEYDIFVRDRQLGTTERVNVSSTGEQSNGPWEYYGQTAEAPGISADGRCVVFPSHATTLITDDSNRLCDVFLRDRLAGTTERVSLTNSGEQSNGESTSASISADGRYVVFASRGGLVPQDRNFKRDIYVRDRWGFGDVPYGHWARLEVEACVAAGIVFGYGPDTYASGDIVTRDQMAVYISRALAGGDDNVLDPAGDPTFPDVPADWWAYKYVEHAVAKNVVSGYDDGSYHPTEEVDRAQMAVYIARAMVAPTGEAAFADYTPSDPRDFPDVPNVGYGDDGTEPFWAYKHIEYCVERGVVQGYEDGLYHPEGKVDRAQMAVYIARAFALPM